MWARLALWTRRPWSARRTSLARQRLTIGPELRFARTTTTAAITAAIAPRAAEAARATGATGATGTARTATRSPSSTRSTPTAELARRRGQLPADTGARHLTAARTIVVLALLFRCARLEARQATRFAITARTAAATIATTGTTATAIATGTTAATITAIAAVAAVVTALLAGDAVDHVVKLAPRNRTMGAGLALIHANQANLIELIADDLERLEQARGAIWLNAKRRSDCVGKRVGLR